MAAALTVLNSLTLNDSEKDLRFVPVQLICKLNSSQKDCFTSEYAAMEFKSSDAAPWIVDDCEYHLVVGVLSTTNNTIQLWNFKEWLLPCTDFQLDGEPVIAVRVACTETMLRPNTSAVAPSLPQWMWCDTPLSLGKWCRLDEGHRRGGKMPGWSLSALFGGGDRSSTTLPMDRDNVALPPPSQHAPLNSSKVAVCISGCHMSTMPCSGVGEGQWAVELSVLRQP